MASMGSEPILWRTPPCSVPGPQDPVLMSRNPQTFFVSSLSALAGQRRPLLDGYGFTAAVAAKSVIRL